MPTHFDVTHSLQRRDPGEAASEDVVTRCSNWPRQV